VQHSRKNYARNSPELSIGTYARALVRFSVVCMMIVGQATVPSFAKEGWLRHKDNGPIP